uniref:Uncharacterized protein n=1 Tax=Anas platyrhynchos TaxID=8839 RepID=A0A8B9QUU1_ANAPL
SPAARIRQGACGKENPCSARIFGLGAAPPRCQLGAGWGWGHRRGWQETAGGGGDPSPPPTTLCLCLSGPGEGAKPHCVTQGTGGSGWALQGVTGGRGQGGPPRGPLTVPVGIPQCCQRRAGSQQRLLQRAGGDVAGVQREAPLRLHHHLLLLLLIFLLPGPAAAQPGSACGQRRGSEPSGNPPGLSVGNGQEEGGLGGLLPGPPGVARSSGTPTTAATRRSMPNPPPRKQAAGRSGWHGPERLGTAGYSSVQPGTARYSMASIPAGLFAVYKPPGVSWCRVRDAVRARLLRELNEAPEPPPRQRIRFLPTAPGAGGEPGLVPAWVPVLAEHPLGKGLGSGLGVLGGWRGCPDAASSLGSPRPPVQAAEGWRWSPAGREGLRSLRAWRRPREQAAHRSLPLPPHQGLHRRWAVWESY